MKTVFLPADFLTPTVLIFNSCKPKVDYELEKQKIESLFNGLYYYFNNNDWEGYSSNYIHDPKLQMIHPGVKSWISGYDEFAKVYESFFEVDHHVSSVSPQYSDSFS